MLFKRCKVRQLADAVRIKISKKRWQCRTTRQRFFKDLSLHNHYNSFIDLFSSPEAFSKNPENISIGCN